MRAQDLVGQPILDSYVGVRVIGSGNMGTVLEVRHVRLPKRFAMKVLHPELGEGAEVFARFRREAEIASSLGHPHIVNVIDWNHLPDGTPFLVMEYLEGEDLHGRMDRLGPLPLAFVLELARQVGSALSAAHKHGVVHRDLKPQNVFLCTEDRGEEEVEVAKVLDFGISKILGGEGTYTGAMRVMGTPLYMAPEQAMGMAQSVDGRADQFALGAILYHALSGQRPFDGASIVEIALKVMSEDPAPIHHLVQGLPPQVGDAIMQALSKDREHRYASVGDFVRALGAAQPGSGVTGFTGHTGYTGQSARVGASGPSPRLGLGLSGQVQITGASGVLRRPDPAQHGGGQGMSGAFGVSGGHGLSGGHGVSDGASGAFAAPSASTPRSPGASGPAGALTPGDRGRGDSGEAPVLTGAPLLGPGGRRAAALGVIAALSAALCFGLVRLALGPRPPPVAVVVPRVDPLPAPVVRPPPVPKVQLRFVVQPATAEIYLDGKRVEAQVAVPKSEMGMRLEVKASGYVPQTDSVVPSSDQRILIRLAPRRRSQPALPPASF